jgi:hypothetical protein
MHNYAANHSKAQSPWDYPKHNDINIDAHSKSKDSCGCKCYDEYWRLELISRLSSICERGDRTPQYEACKEHQCRWRVENPLKMT